jgi:hypothetical protein
MRLPYRAGTGRCTIAYIFSVYSFSLSLLSALQSPILAALFTPRYSSLVYLPSSSRANLVGTTKNHHAATPRTYPPRKPAQGHIGMSSETNPHAGLLIHETDRPRHHLASRQALHRVSQGQAMAVRQEPPCHTAASGSTAGLSSSHLRRRSHLWPCTTPRTVCSPSLARRFCPPSHPPLPRRTRRPLIHQTHRLPSCLCRAHPHQAPSQTCRVSLMRIFARQAPRLTMPCPPAHPQRLTASCVLRLNQIAPNLGAGVRSRFRCARHRLPTGTACLRGRGSDG